MVSLQQFLSIASLKVEELKKYKKFVIRRKMIQVKLFTHFKMVFKRFGAGSDGLENLLKARMRSQLTLFGLVACRSMEMKKGRIYNDAKVSLKKYFEFMVSKKYVYDFRKNLRLVIGSIT